MAAMTSTGTDSSRTVLAVANQKGGVAKTTSVASLGAALAELGSRVLLVDLDPQACLTFSLGIELEDLDEYDWVLLDCPPSLGVLTVAALTAADGVLIPLQCETLSHRGVGQLLDTVHDVRRFTNRDLEVWGVLPTLYDGRTNHARTVLETISETYDLEVVEPPIPKTIKFAEAPAAGRSILATSRSSKGAKAYREAATHLVERSRQPRNGLKPSSRW